MAYTLFKENKVWHCRFTIDGKRVQRSTGETERPRARDVAERIYHDAALWARNGRVIPTLAELVGMWISVHENAVSTSHIEGMERFGRLHLQGLAGLPIDKLTTDRVEEVRNVFLRDHSAGAANHWHRQLRLLVRWAVARGVIADVPFRLKAIKIQRRPRATLPTDLTGQWLDAVDECASEGVQLAIRLMLGLGLREMEAATARWEWLDAVRATYTPGRTKGKEADALPIPHWLLDHLRPLRKVSGLIAARPDGRAYGRQFTRKAIADANRKVGIMGVTAHRLRASYATLLSKNGAPVQSIQRALRHRDVATTLRYLEVDMHHIALAQATMATTWGLA